MTGMSWPGSGTAASVGEERTRTSRVLTAITGPDLDVGGQSRGPTTVVAEIEEIGPDRLEERLIVTDRHDRRSVRESIEEHLDKSRPRQRILTEGRLVDDEDSRSRCHHGRHRQAPFLSSGQALRVRLREFGQTE